MVKIKIRKGMKYNPQKEFLDRTERLREREKTERLRSEENRLIYKERTRQPRLAQEVRRLKIKERAAYKKERPIERLKQEFDTSRLKKAFRSKSETKAIKRRERAVKGIARAIGVIGGEQRYAGAGRPRGSYKHGMPIHIYKALQRQKMAQYSQFQQEQQAKLRYKGFTPEQIQQLQQQQAIQELEMPSQQEVMEQVQSYPTQQYPSQQERKPIQIIPQRPGYQKMKVPTGQSYVQPGPSVADEELDFRKWSAEKTISPNTQRILDTIRRIQNKGKSDNINQMRLQRERLLVGRSMSIFSAHRNMIDTSLDFTGIPSDNILLAENCFKENSENNILKPRGGNILNTSQYGNTLKFF